MAYIAIVLVCVAMVTMLPGVEGRLCQIDPAALTCMDVVPRAGPLKGVSLCSSAGKECQLKIRRRSIECRCEATLEGYQLL
ncbi:hypothetical protein DPMN_059020 [Dreissena polymorpha]|uniref:Uncharacterized protein n=1 Tax=Dreissena polymorpha TaxID=45954 RepID=A0A9D4HGU5_DREPO|nr:hypothetical protein DPMN_059020 [Dreissena polymorpha]